MASAVVARPPLSSLLCNSLSQLRNSLTPTSRLLSLDLTTNHISLALSDSDRANAVPFGFLARTAVPRADATILSSALHHAARHEPRHTLNLHALVVNVSPLADSNSIAAYVDDILREGEGFKDIVSVLFYAEAHVMQRTLQKEVDYVNTLQALPLRMEPKQRRRFLAAMDPAFDPSHLTNSYHQRARISASETLQVVLDQLKRLD